MFKNASHTPSFMVVVFCYQSSGSILKFFEPVLKPTTEGSQTEPLYSRTGHSSPLSAASFTSCGQAYRFRLRKPRVRLALVQILQICVFHLKSFMIVTPIFQDIWFFRCFRGPFPPEYMQHGSFWSVSLLFASYCNLIPHFLVQHGTAFQLICIFLKFQCVLCILNFSVTNTVIRKESYFRITVCWDIINEQRKQQGTKDHALWDTIQNQGLIRFCSVYNNSLLAVAQKSIISISVSSHLCYGQTVRS